MSTAAAPKSSTVYRMSSSHGPAHMYRGKLQSRSVQVIKLEDFETYKDTLKEALKGQKYNQEAILYAVAGAVMLLACFAVIVYLNFVIPATFVWPGVSKLLVAAGLAGLFMGGVFSCAKAYESFKKAPDSQNNGSISDIVDSCSEDMETYQVSSEHLTAVEDSEDES